MIDLPFPSKINHSIALRAVNFPLDYFWPLMRLGVPLILLGIAASSLITSIFAYISPPVKSTTNAFGVLISPIPFIVASSIYAVAIHRFILKQEEINLSNVRIGANAISYTLVIIMFVCMDRIVDVAAIFVAWLYTKQPASEFPLVFIINPELFQYKPMDLMPRPIHGLALLVRGLLFWLYIRLSLSLPHAAVEGRVSLQTSWKLTQGYFWRGVGLIFSLTILQFPLGFFIFAVFSIVIFYGVYLLGENFNFVPYLFAVIITPVICVFFAMCIALLSYTYEELRGPA